MMARLPEMKSFCTSTTTSAELGLATFLIHSVQQNTNSSLVKLPLALTLKMFNNSSTSLVSILQQNILIMTKPPQSLTFNLINNHNTCLREGEPPTAVNVILWNVAFLLLDCIYMTMITTVKFDLKLLSGFYSTNSGLIRRNLQNCSFL